MQNANYSVRESENVLFAAKVIVTVLIWVGAALLLGTLGKEAATVVATLLIYVVFFLLFFWFRKIFLVAYVKGEGILVSEGQFPEVFAIYSDIAKQLELENTPPLFILQSGGILNAFAVRFGGKNYIAIYSDVFALYKTDIESVKFVLAHELGHVKRKHIQKSFWTFPSFIIPFLNSAYSRACEYTCDNIGSSFVSDENSRLNGLLLLAGGKDIYKEINIDNYIKTAEQNRSFIVKYVNLFRSHPYLPNRIENIQAKTSNNTLGSIIIIFLTGIVITLGIGMAYYALQSTVDKDAIADKLSDSGKEYLHKGDFDLAINDYTAVLKIKPDNLEALSGRGDAYYYKGDFDLAIADYTEILRIEPDDYDAHNTLGVIHYAKGNFDQAIAGFNAALQIKPDYLNALDNRGEVYAKKGDFNRAIADWEAILWIEPAADEIKQKIENARKSTAINAD
ncbi:MAG: tetratricopeptide repeat protein [Fibromonadaceae bacterium]|jgi:Zn-dependent protease with chaperone function/Tfp pilus assembly protein PilF|nr:tetratricopeptide repeat protein [Fibromonadaceae bacterium]